MHQPHRMLLLLLIKPNPYTIRTHTDSAPEASGPDTELIITGPTVHTLTGLAGSQMRGLKRWPCLPFDLCEQNALGCPAAPAHTRLT